MSEQQPPIPVQYVVSYEKPKINHLLHLILTLITVGLWLPVWIVMGIYGASTQRQKVAGIYGATHPGHPGAAGVPQLPGSQQDLLNPRPRPLTNGERRDELTRRAWGFGWLGLLLSLFAVGLGPIGPILVLLATAGAIWFVLWQRSQIADPPAAGEQHL